MKSKMNAMRTIATTYQITPDGLLRVLERDALQHLGDRHAAVGRPLEGIVHLLPLHDIERLGRSGEERANRRVVDRVALFFEPLDLCRLVAHDLALPDGGHARLDVLRRLYQHA